MKNESGFCLEVAGISVVVSSCDPSLKLEAQGAVKDFLTGEGKPDARASAAWSDLSQVKLGPKLFDSGALWQLYRRDGWYLYCFTSPIFGPFPYKVASFNLNFTLGEVYLHRQYFEPQRAFYPLEYPLDELWMVNLLCQGRGAEVHGCGVVDAQGEGHLFVGQSGAGKSAMARLWQPHKSVKILSDDRIILRKAEQKLWMYGTPWHGEAGFSTTARAPVSQIYFLQHGEKNELLPQRAAQAVGRLFACGFPPFYSPGALDFMLGFFEEVVKAVPCFELRFLPDQSALEFIHSALRVEVGVRP
ncbi:hypothetical protein MYX75_10210 [Acidobacteria bacterium AH-259-A15]|nr:hypothetical protein [Acidobacteria bacterium AH-259-A15]